MKHMILPIIIGVVALSGCGKCIKGEGAPISERRTVSEFTNVEANSNIRVMINQVDAADGQYVIIEAQENLIPEIITSTSRGTLKIETKGCIKSNTDLVVNVFASDYRELSLNGTGNVESTAVINTQRLQVNNKGTGSVMLEIRADRLDVSNTGTGSVVLQGATNDLHLDNRGTGSIQAPALRAENAKVDSRGTGTVQLQVHGELDIKLSGTGDVVYQGNPQNIKQRNTGIGKIRRD